MFDAARRNVAGVHLIRRTRVATFFVCHGTDEGNVVHYLCNVGEVVGNPDSVDIGLNGLRGASVFVFGLGIKRFKLAGTASHPQKNHGLALFSQTFCLHGHQVSKSQASESRPGCNRLNESSPRESFSRHSNIVVKMNGHRFSFAVTVSVWEFTITAVATKGCSCRLLTEEAKRRLPLRVDTYLIVL